MTILRRIGALAFVPGIPGTPATPGRSTYVEVPDPPSQTELSFGGAGVSTSSLFGKNGTVVVSSAGGEDAAGGSGRPPTPGIIAVDSYNGNKGSYVVITQPDGSTKVVKV